MGWHVDLVKNNTVISEECATELNALLPEYEREDGIVYAYEEDDGVWMLHFDSEAMEHIDGWLYDKEVVDILLRHKINGEARFAKTDGDGGPQVWEHFWVDGVHDLRSKSLRDIDF